MTNAKMKLNFIWCLILTTHLCMSMVKHQLLFEAIDRIDELPRLWSLSVIHWRKIEHTCCHHRKWIGSFSCRKPVFDHWTKRGGNYSGKPDRVVKRQVNFAKSQVIRKSWQVSNSHSSINHEKYSKVYEQFSKYIDEYSALPSLQRGVHI